MYYESTTTGMHADPLISLRFPRATSDQEMQMQCTYRVPKLGVSNLDGLKFPHEVGPSHLISCLIDRAPRGSGWSPEPASSPEGDATPHLAAI